MLPHTSRMARRASSLLLQRAVAAHRSAAALASAGSVAAALPCAAAASCSLSVAASAAPMHALGRTGVACFSTSRPRHFSSSAARGPPPQPFTSEEQARILTWSSSGKSLEASSMREALTFFRRAIEANALRNDVLETHLLLRILSQYNSWQVPVFVPRGADDGDAQPTLSQHRLVTQTYRHEAGQVVPAFVEGEDVPDSVLFGLATPEHEVRLATVSGIDLFARVLHASAQPGVDAQHAIRAVSFSDTAAKEFCIVAVDLAKNQHNRWFLESAITSAATSPVLRDLTREQILTTRLPAWFGANAAAQQHATGGLLNPAVRPIRFFTLFSGENLVGAGNGVLTLFPGYDHALHFVRLFSAQMSGMQELPLTATEVLDTCNDAGLDVVIMSDLRPATGTATMHKFTRDELKQAASVGK